MDTIQTENTSCQLKYKIHCKDIVYLNLEITELSRKPNKKKKIHKNCILRITVPSARAWQRVSKTSDTFYRNMQQNPVFLLLLHLPYVVRTSIYIKIKEMKICEWKESLNEVADGIKRVFFVSVSHVRISLSSVQYLHTYV